MISLGLFLWCTGGFFLLPARCFNMQPGGVRDGLRIESFSFDLFIFKS